MTKPINEMTRQELDELACATADPATLSDETIARMKELKVGPFAHDFTLEMLTDG